MRSEKEIRTKLNADIEELIKPKHVYDTNVTRERIELLRWVLEENENEI